MMPSASSASGLNGKVKRDAQGEKWERQFQSLVEYKQKVGNCDVPFRFEENPRLAAWVSHQRKLQKRGDLPSMRLRRLDEIGFLWNSERKATWDQRLEDLKDYKRKYGTTAITESCFNPEHIQLSRWASKQRSSFRCRDFRYLTKERRRKLEEIGFIWDGEDALWQMRFRELSDFWSKNGAHSELDSTLQGWADTQFRKIMANTQPADRVELLQQIGFSKAIAAKTIRRRRSCDDGSLANSEAKSGAIAETVSRVPLLQDVRDREKELSEARNFHVVGSSVTLYRVLNATDSDFGSGPQSLDGRARADDGFRLEPQTLRIEDSSDKDDEYGESPALVTTEPDGVHASLLLGFSQHLHREDSSPDRQGRMDHSTSLQDEVLDAGNAPEDVVVDESPLRLNDRRWNKRFNELLQYRTTFGNCDVPFRFLENPKLAVWVNSQRTSFRANRLPVAKLEKLTAVGFLWNSVRRVKWEQCLEHLEKYKEHFGTTAVSPLLLDSSNSYLLKWTENQRPRRRDLCEERKKKLDDLGFVWDRDDAAWLVRWVEIVEFQKVNEKIMNVPDIESIIKKWADSQLSLAEEGVLEKWKVDMLNSIRSDWRLHVPVASVAAMPQRSSTVATTASAKFTVTASAKLSPALITTERDLFSARRQANDATVSNSLGRDTLLLGSIDGSGAADRSSNRLKDDGTASITGLPQRAHLDPWTVHPQGGELASVGYSSVGLEPTTPQVHSLFSPRSPGQASGSSLASDSPEDCGTSQVKGKRRRSKSRGSNIPQGTDTDSRTLSVAAMNQSIPLMTYQHPHPPVFGLFRGGDPTSVAAAALVNPRNKTHLYVPETVPTMGNTSGNFSYPIIVPPYMLGASLLLDAGVGLSLPITPPQAAAWTESRCRKKKQKT